MTEVAVPQSADLWQAPSAAPAVRSTEPLSGLAKWAFEAQQAHLIAQSLAKTSFVPVTLRGKPHDITAAILAGDELGMRPMASLRSMDVIQGTPALRAHAMRGLVQSHGHSVQPVGKPTATRCVMRGRRAGEQEWIEVEWTIERAVALGLPKRNPEWEKQPITMLMARATGEICRLIAADVLLAMPYASEELDGYAAPVAAVGSRWHQPPVTSDELGDDPPDALPAPAAPVEDRWPQVAAALVACEVDSAGAAAVLSDLLGRRVDDPVDLSPQDQATVLELLGRCVDQDEPARALDAVLAELAAREGKL